MLYYKLVSQHVLSVISVISVISVRPSVDFLIKCGWKKLVKKR